MFLLCPLWRFARIYAVSNIQTFQQTFILVFYCLNISQDLELSTLRLCRWQTFYKVQYSVSRNILTIKDETLWPLCYIHDASMKKRKAFTVFIRDHLEIYYYRILFSRFQHVATQSMRSIFPPNGLLKFGLMLRFFLLSRDITFLFWEDFFKILLHGDKIYVLIILNARDFFFFYYYRMFLSPSCNIYRR